MAKAILEKQLLVRVPDRKGMLAKISSTLASAGVNIRGICAYAEKGKGYFMIVTSNTSDAVKVLKPMHFPVKKEEVILLVLEDKIGILGKVCGKLASYGINLRYIYGTIGGSKKVCLLVLSSNNNRKALKVLQKIKV